MCRAGAEPCPGDMPVESVLKYEYNCQSEIMYVYVDAVDGVDILKLPDDTFVKVKEFPGSGKVADPTCGEPSGLSNCGFAWVPLVGDVAEGWEASFALPIGGEYRLTIHTQVDDGGSQTSALRDYPISTDVECGPTAVVVSGFVATSQRKAIRLDWETASEVDNLGFSLYRATMVDGPRKQVNAKLIPTKSPGSVYGAEYTYTDTTVRRSWRWDWTKGLVLAQSYFYWLEDVDIHGNRGLTGPVEATPGEASLLGPIPFWRAE